MTIEELQQLAERLEDLAKRVPDGEAAARECIVAFDEERLFERWEEVDEEQARIFAAIPEETKEKIKLMSRIDTAHRKLRATLTEWKKILDKKYDGDW